MSWLLLALAGAAAVVDWFGVWRGAARIEMAAKPAVPFLLCAALTARSSHTRVDLLVLVGLLFALLGDIALLPRINRFIVGLSCFLATNMVLAAAFVTALDSPGQTQVAAIVAVALGSAVFGNTVIRRVRADSSRPDRQVLSKAILAYVVVQTTMLAAAITTGDAGAVAGAGLLVASDMVLSWDRFVDALPRGRFITHILYHAALITLTAWAL